MLFAQSEKLMAIFRHSFITLGTGFIGEIDFRKSSLDVFLIVGSWESVRSAKLVELISNRV